MRNRWNMLHCVLIWGMLWNVGGGHATPEPAGPSQMVQRLVHLINSLKTTPQTNDVTAAKEANTILDIPAVSQRTLGKHWQARTPAEQQEFIALLEQLFAKIAYPKSAEFFHGLEIKVAKENVAGQRATVQTTVRHPKEGLVSVDYKLIQDRGSWRVQDILLDDVSLAANLQSQFNKIITENSYAELLRRMRDKLNE
ncbi:MAG: ABC transporter substrate-binding protein [Candidatus Tectomicrobia bacterium]|uniref:ABC transporter substrate-binding protein n=1 Tax=Tectimicrobiota bacterium TaxID=2528274 RepID=A0A937W4S9_UNCTE|nr:ABC transporter substrate-binding protein [Candidatus Tectomicrobia bacterium]